MSNLELAIDWIKRYGMSFVDSASLLGWILIAIFAVLPFAVAISDNFEKVDFVSAPGQFAIR